jgi:hypothetical protein
MRCLGRHVSDTAGRLQFCDGGYFHIELRCSVETETGLCAKCLEKEHRARERSDGTRLKGMAPSVIHGRITEPIPPWSHIFGGEWYEKQLKKGRTISEETMVRAKKAKESAGQAVIDKFFVEGPDPVPVKPIVITPVVKSVTKKKVTAVASLPSAQARLQSVAPIEPDEVVEIAVRPFEHSGASYFIAPSSSKLYTKQFKYVGRWNAKSMVIEAYPDSDSSVQAEALNS